MSFILEDKALLKFRDKEYIATIKGVDSNYAEVTRFTEVINRGDYFGRMTDEVGVVGIGVAYHLNLLRIDFVDPIQVYVPRQDFSASADPENSVNSLPLYPIGTFSVQPDYDIKYVVTPIDYARQLFSKPEGVSSIEVKCRPGVQNDQVKNKLLELLGPGHKVLNRNEQQATIFRVIQAEGLATFLILAFILTIASFGIMGSLTMLILEKKEDMFTLKSLGADRPLIKRIFLTEGLLISFLGCISGLLLGIVLVVLQQQFGLLSLGQGYAVNAYPMEIRPSDLVKVTATVMGIGTIVSILAVRKI
jgi:lipoprotein-releasing system permease protein